MTMQVDKARLDEMLVGMEGVTPGPWDVKTQEDWDAGFSFFGGPNGAFTFPVDGEPLDIAHIARCDPDTIRSIITELLELRSLRSTEGKEGEPIAWQTRHANHNGGRWVSDEADDKDYRATSGKLGWEFRPLYATPEAAEAHVAKLSEALKPFAEAAENLDDNHADGSPIWETSAAMGIDARHLRAARAALTRSPE